MTKLSLNKHKIKQEVNFIIPNEEQLYGSGIEHERLALLARRRQ